MFLAVSSVGRKVRIASHCSKGIGLDAVVRGELVVPLFLHVQSNSAQSTTKSRLVVGKDAVMAWCQSVSAELHLCLIFSAELILPCVVVAVT